MTGTALELATWLIQRPDVRGLFASDPESLADHERDLARLRTIAQDRSRPGSDGSYAVAGRAAFDVLTVCSAAVARIVGRLGLEPEAPLARQLAGLGEGLARTRARYAQRIGLDDGDNG